MPSSKTISSAPLDESTGGLLTALSMFVAVECGLRLLLVIGLVATIVTSDSKLRSKVAAALSVTMCVWLFIAGRPGWTFTPLPLPVKLVVSVVAIGAMVASKTRLANAKLYPFLHPILAMLLVEVSFHIHP